MKKHTRHSVQWFYNLLAKGECETLDFKEQLEDKLIFGKSQRSFSPNYESLAKDVVAFANKKGGFLFIGIVDEIDNEAARKLLNLGNTNSNSVQVSKLFAEMLEKELIVIVKEEQHNRRIYKRK